MNEELIQKLRQTKSPEEVIAVAADFNEEISPEKARELFKEIQNLSQEELSLNDLNLVSGGHKLDQYLKGLKK